jgi:hypothetical protein
MIIKKIYNLLKTIYILNIKLRFQLEISLDKFEMFGLSCGAGDRKTSKRFGHRKLRLRLSMHARFY